MKSLQVNSPVAVRAFNISFLFHYILNPISSFFFELKSIISSLFISSLPNPVLVVGDLSVHNTFFLVGTHVLISTFGELLPKKRIWLVFF